MSNIKARFVPSARRGFLFLILIIASITYAFLHRQWTDWWLYSYTAAIPLAIGFMFREGRMYWENAQTSREKAFVIARLLLPAPILAIFLTPVGGIYYGTAAAITDVLFWIALQLSENGRSASLAVIATALLGSIFFVFRLKLRFIYGLTEAMVGLMVAGHRVGFDPTSMAGGNAALFFAVLTAGVYLVVRGLDNMHQAWETKSDLALNWFLSEPHEDTE